MLDAVMSEGGLRVVREATRPGLERIEAVLAESDPGGQWQRVGQTLRRAGPAADAPDTPRWLRRSRRAPASTATSTGPDSSRRARCASCTPRCAT